MALSGQGQEDDREEGARHAAGGWLAAQARELGFWGVGRAGELPGRCLADVRRNQRRRMYVRGTWAGK